MASRHTNARANKDEVVVSSTTTDSPILPVEQIARLQELAPHRVDWVFEQTQIESETRRNENIRINTLVFIERIAGLILAFLVAAMGLGAAAYCATINQPIVASVIGGTTLVGLVTAFIAGRKQSPSPQSKK